MLTSTFTLLEIGRSALMAARRSMDVTGHNVANASTPGYSRQEVLLEPIIQRIPLAYGISGIGVKVSDVVRIRDRFIDAVLRNESQKKASYAVQKDILDHLQVVFGEPSDASLRQAVDSFWSAWHDLASEPLSQAARSQVMERGRSLADMFKHVGGQIDSLVSDIEADIEITVKKVNVLSERVASLNIEITRASARKEPTADLLDRRDLLLDEIAELTGATVTYLDEGNSCKVQIGGFPIVEHDKVYHIKVMYQTDGTKFGIEEIQNSVIDCMGGRLRGCKTGRDNIAFEFKQEIESILVDLVTGVNNLHTNGYPLSGTPIPFFEFSPDDCIGTLKVSDQIVSDPGQICASTEADQSLYNGLNALSIADFIDGQTTEAPSFVDRWMGTVGRLGAMGQKVQSGYETQELLVKELQNRKDAVSGVSLDEEIANLVREQHAFNAASRVISAADEMLDTIINKMGLVGR